MSRLPWLLAAGALALTGCAPNPEVFESAGESATPAAVEVTGTATHPSMDAVAETSPSPTVTSCRDVASSLSPAEQVGQLFMIGVDTGGLDEATRSAIANARVGSVVLLGNTSAGASPIRQLTAELGSLGSHRVPVLIAVDQEGGTVQRLKGEGFSSIPSAREQGALAEGDLRAAAQQWGEELREVGVHYDLAPVADVVSEAKRGTNEPIGQLNRDYGSDPEAVSQSIVEFVEGMGAASVATSVKHFPGLGEVVTNTDFGIATDDVIEADGESLEPFAAAIDAGVDSVMVSSAVFTKIDPDNEGVFSSVVIEDLLRDDLGFDGVVIADDLGAAKSVSGVAPADRALRFFDAGGDLLINANPSLMATMADATLGRAQSDAEFADRVLDSVERVLRLKSGVGLVDCA
ncbi:glycoside hydrolase family 3 N-terminal domain-containing protein [Tessaracoccus flavus]|uniref:beta-N-acetylhexosaminidase n=1 Tax=Tessaracoccus flavus TaxID=1610493 RepID=A0A1Q2CC56_9ACTN|nr:glycoside hydrolase family 3 N-terminal domain-containing protein [Tessaracoccus flavus]AQP43689.1 hypothetical protein RPIT_01745 [Tessaracoccus flavus]SDZ02777.1 beta-N-acetylhexosaminidase [Tessaracoccus flavus]